MNFTQNKARIVRAIRGKKRLWKKTLKSSCYFWFDILADIDDALLPTDNCFHNDLYQRTKSRQLRFSAIFENRLYSVAKLGPKAIHRMCPKVKY